MQKSLLSTRSFFQKSWRRRLRIHKLEYNSILYEKLSVNFKAAFPWFFSLRIRCKCIYTCYLSAGLEYFSPASPLYNHLFPQVPNRLILCFRGPSVNRSATFSPVHSTNLNLNLHPQIPSFILSSLFLLLIENLRPNSYYLTTYLPKISS